MDAFAERPTLEDEILAEETHCEEYLAKQVATCELMASVLVSIDALVDRLQ